MLDLKLKRCSTCKREKPLSDFGKDARMKDGLKRRCRECRSREEKSRKEYKHEFYVKNKEKIAKLAKEYTESHKEEIRQYKKEWNKANEGRLSLKRKQYYIDNRESWSKNYKSRYNRIKNDPSKKAKMMESNKKYKESHRWIAAWRSVLATTLTRMGLNKSGRTKDLLGYDSNELRKHIENLWTPGMSWENYGEWHIDHKTPLYTFPKDTPVNIVNALENLRPLWATTKEVNGTIYRGNLNRRKLLGMDKSIKTCFLDVDGTLAYHDPEVIAGKKEMTLIPGVLQKLSEWYGMGYVIILTTGRDISLLKETEGQLARAGVYYDDLVMNMGRGMRILINDKKPDGELTAKCYNLDRNTGIGVIDE